jgi:hypothetical protein
MSLAVSPGLPDVQRTLNWVHLASRYPVRVRVENPPPELVSSQRVGRRRHSRPLRWVPSHQSLDRLDQRGVPPGSGNSSEEELAPYPGRVFPGRAHGHGVNPGHDHRHDVPAFPISAYSALFALILSRESRRRELRRPPRDLVVGVILGGVYVVVGAMLVLGNPMLRFLWVGGTLFLAFYGLSALSNYTAAARFAYLTVITIPLWDSRISSESKVEKHSLGCGSDFAWERHYAAHGSRFCRIQTNRSSEPQFVNAWLTWKTCSRASRTVIRCRRQPDPRWGG